MLKPSPIEPVPEGTARVAKAAFRKGNPLLSLRDELGAVFADADFADLFPRPEFAVVGERARIPVLYQKLARRRRSACAHNVDGCRAAQPTARIVLGAEMPSFLKISASSGWIVVA
jgi:hypothetical protein